MWCSLYQQCGVQLGILHDGRPLWGAAKFSTALIFILPLKSFNYTTLISLEPVKDGVDTIVSDSMVAHHLPNLNPVFYQQYEVGLSRLVYPRSDKYRCTRLAAAAATSCAFSWVTALDSHGVRFERHFVNPLSFIAVVSCMPLQTTCSFSNSSSNSSRNRSSKRQQYDSQR